MGRATLGRIINVIGEAIDERGDISKDLFHPLIFFVFCFCPRILSREPLISLDECWKLGVEVSDCGAVKENDN